jgi:hypothetical protein
MSKKTFIVAKTNVVVKSGKLGVGTEYQCEEKDVAHLVKSGRLVVAVAPKKVKAEPKKDAKEEK